MEPEKKSSPSFVYKAAVNKWERDTSNTKCETNGFWLLHHTPHNDDYGSREMRLFYYYHNAIFFSPYSGRWCVVNCLPTHAILNIWWQTARGTISNRRDVLNAFSIFFLWLQGSHSPRRVACQLYRNFHITTLSKEHFLLLYRKILELLTHVLNSGTKHHHHEFFIFYEQ